MDLPAPSSRFAAILALDIAGYSRLMELDEAGTFDRVRHIMEGIVAPGVANTGGRLVKTTGDGALAEWPDVGAAVRCALAIQTENEAHERQERPDRRARFRAGLHAGEVIASGGDIFGEGVNIAARLEGIAGVGEVYASETVAAAAPDSFRFVDLGQRRLKNIARPVRVFRAADSGDERAGSGAAAGTPELYVQGFGDYPAIAVLPFRDGGAADPHFAEGVTEDVISMLSRWGTFPVISRNSVYALAGGTGALDLRLVGQLLGVRYVLEGELRRADGRLRASVSLVDVDTDTVLLRDSHECALGDIFAMQDQIVRNVVGRLEPALLHHERARVASARPGNPTVYEAVQLAAWHHYKYTRENNLLAREGLGRVLEADPENIRALTLMALATTHAANVGWLPDKDAGLREATALARTAVALSPRDPAARFALGTVCQNTSRPDEAAEHLQAAVELNPSHAAAHANLGFVYCFLDRPDEGLAPMELALRLSPSDPRRFMWVTGMAASHFLAGRHRASLHAAREVLSLNASYPVALRYAAAALGAMGRAAEAGPIVTLLRRMDGDLAGTARHLRRSYTEAPVLRLLDGLRRAGFT